MTLRVQVRRDFMNGRSMAFENHLIEVSESRARELERNGLVSREIRRSIVNYIPGEQVPEISADRLPPLMIGIPAWGPYYVDLACRYVVPAILASLADSNFHNVTFVVHTDDQAPFREAIGDLPIKFPPLRRMGPIPTDQRLPQLPANYWDAFKQAHREVLQATPHGGIAVLLNSDVVPSRECFRYVQEQMIAGKRVVASVGIRTQAEQAGSMPIGSDAETLFRWIWGYRHHITDECIWGRGTSQHPTILFFEDGANVAMRCFHLTPMFVRRDRQLPFKGTIDDDLLGRFLDEEIAYPSAGEVAFAELSPAWKTHPHGTPLNVPDVLEFWLRRMMRPHYLRNFEQRMTVLGAPAANHPAADKIVAGLNEVWT